jgi:hypothetical protein
MAEVEPIKIHLSESQLQAAAELAAARGCASIEEYIAVLITESLSKSQPGQLTGSGNPAMHLTDKMQQVAGDLQRLRGELSAFLPERATVFALETPAELQTPIATNEQPPEQRRSAWNDELETLAIDLFKNSPQLRFNDQKQVPGQAKTQTAEGVNNAAGPVDATFAEVALTESVTGSSGEPLSAPSTVTLPAPDHAMANLKPEKDPLEDLLDQDLLKTPKLAGAAAGASVLPSNTVVQTPTSTSEITAKPELEDNQTNPSPSPQINLPGISGNIPPPKRRS